MFELIRKKYNQFHDNIYVLFVEDVQIELIKTLNEGEMRS